MLVKTEARILIFPGTDFHFPSTSVPPGTFLGSAVLSFVCQSACYTRRPHGTEKWSGPVIVMTDEHNV